MKKLLEQKSPWMGIEPRVTFRMEDGICYVADRDLVERKYQEKVGNLRYIKTRKLDIQSAIQDSETTVIGYQSEEFQRSLSHLENDFTEFLERVLKKRMEELAPEYADDFCMEFRKRYGMPAD